MRRATSLAAATAMLLSLAGSAFASGVYEDHRLVRLWPDTAREQLTVAGLPMTLMSEAVLRDGGTMYLATPDVLSALGEAGVEYEVVLEDVQAMVDAERARLDARERWDGAARPRGSDAFFEEFRDLAELHAFYDGLLAAHPGLITRELIGQSVQGRNIYAYTIAAPGDADARPSLIFNGTAHAREWISPMTVSYIMRGLVEGYGNDPRITAVLENATFRIAPVMNPDGYVYSWTNERYWRKTRRNNGDGTFGVDWNRNFDANWSAPGASGDSFSDTYYGTAPFSEPETRALRDYLLAVPNRAFHIDFHSFSQLILYPWGYTNSPIPQPDLGIHQSLSTAYADTIRSTTGAEYLPIQSSDLYITSGSSGDWSYLAGDVFSFGLELRPADGSFEGFSPPPSAILPCAMENFEAVLGLAESVGSGVIAFFPGGQPVSVEPGEAAAVSIRITPAFSGDLVPSSATLWTRVGDAGAFTPTPMSAAGEVYTGLLPAAPCGSEIRYYATIESVGGAEYSIPPGAPASVYAVDVLETAVAFADDIETDLGWTAGVPGDDATTGQWERANPQGTAAQPENDHTPGGTICWVTGASAGSGVGSFDVDNGTTTLISPAFDATGEPGQEAFVSFWYWYSNDQGASPNADEFVVRISGDDGQTWALLDTITASTNAWVRARYRVADAVEPSAAVRLRFEASDLGDGSIVEAAIDDVAVELVGCSGNPADLAPPFGVLDLADLQAFVTAFVAGDSPADLAEPFGVLDLSDVQAFVTAFVAGP